MKGTMIVVGLLTLAVATSSVMAQTQTPRVTKHQFKQEARIHNGVKSGELTRGEAVRLHAQQAKIKRDKKRARADGMVTQRERTKLTREQNRANKNVYLKKHNHRRQ